MNWKCWLVSLICLVESVCSQDADFWKKQAENLIQDHLSVKPNTKIAKNIILFIGDGLSLATATAARIYDGQRHGTTGEENNLIFERLDHTALIKTYCTNKQVADSACTATAIASGVKTKSRVIGLDDSVLLANCSTVTDESKLSTILRWAQEVDKSTGIVTTTRITHATPAAFYAHSADRDWEDDSAVPEDHRHCKDIARQLVEELPGYSRWRSSTFLRDSTDVQYTNRTGRRSDKRNLVEDWVADKFKRNFAYSYVHKNEEFNEIDTEETDYLLGLFDHSHMKYESDRNNSADGQPSLSRMVNTAVKILQKNKKGYFLMVEGGRIDHAHHENHARYALEETISFSNTISTALKMVNLEETLVLVTADHAHSLAISGYSNRGHPILKLAGTRSDVDAKPYTTLMYAVGPGYVHVPDGRENVTEKLTDTKPYRQHSTVPASSAAHDGEDVVAYAQGPMAHLVDGVMEQNSLAYVMAYSACIGPARKTQLCTKRRLEASSAAKSFDVPTTTKKPTTPFFTPDPMDIDRDATVDIYGTMQGDAGYSPPATGEVLRIHSGANDLSCRVNIFSVIWIIGCIYFFTTL
ncbi:Alkaline phosphatase, tissue-nonspecific isozyme [Hypsibius exemplaris]|uniref:Alkaline phosphatase n=1 Tax=Hypsibius exemplaris TaxID=2072580 RepID=A0A1W0WV99_HYPEX|nr:Alkaline phosphatase, tissue-nonspecific isozyme [Hypsibius exemplaris]